MNFKTLLTSFLTLFLPLVPTLAQEPADSLRKAFGKEAVPSSKGTATPDAAFSATTPGAISRTRNWFPTARSSRKPGTPSLRTRTGRRILRNRSRSGSSTPSTPTAARTRRPPPRSSDTGTGAPTRASTSPIRKGLRSMPPLTERSASPTMSAATATWSSSATKTAWKPSTGIFQKARSPRANGSMPETSSDSAARPAGLRARTCISRPATRGTPSILPG